MDIIFIDLCKAFDKVPHRRLLLKLKRLGIGGNLILWLDAFLSDREQRVVLGNFLSNWIKVSSGVPQGSVLGPTLFTVFVNDLASNLLNLCKLYADDLKIVAKVETEEDVLKLQSDLDKVAYWCRLWMMEPNVEKCKA